MIHRYILGAFILCEVSSAIAVSMHRAIQTFFIVLLYHIVIFAILLVMVFILSIFRRLSLPVKYFFSFLVSYCSLMVILQDVNGAKGFVLFIATLHRSTDFLTSILPFIVSNLMMIFFLARKKVNV